MFFLFTTFELQMNWSMQQGQMTIIYFINSYIYYILYIIIFEPLYEKLPEDILHCKAHLLNLVALFIQYNYYIRHQF